VFADKMFWTSNKPAKRTLYISFELAHPSIYVSMEISTEVMTTRALYYLITQRYATNLYCPYVEIQYYHTETAQFHSINEDHGHISVYLKSVKILDKFLPFFLRISILCSIIWRRNYS
jgi:hypothetical protein